MQFKNRKYPTVIIIIPMFILREKRENDELD